MAEAYWTNCMYCGGMICGVEVLQNYPDVVVLYAHTTWISGRNRAKTYGKETYGSKRDLADAL